MSGWKACRDVSWKVVVSVLLTLTMIATMVTGEAVAEGIGANGRQVGEQEASAVGEDGLAGGSKPESNDGVFAASDGGDGTTDDSGDPRGAEDTLSEVENNDADVEFGNKGETGETDTEASTSSATATVAEVAEKIMDKAGDDTSAEQLITFAYQAVSDLIVPLVEANGGRDSLTSNEVLAGVPATPAEVAATMREVLSELGLESDVILSADGLATWNVVLLDGEWLHLDVWRGAIARDDGTADSWLLLTAEELLAREPTRAGWASEFGACEWEEPEEEPQKRPVEEAAEAAEAAEEEIAAEAAEASAQADVAAATKEVASEEAAKTAEAAATKREVTKGKASAGSDGNGASGGIAASSVGTLTKSSSTKSKRDISKSTCKVTIATQAWTGKQLKPTPTVKWGSTKLKKGTHFKIVSYGTNKNNGTKGNWVKIQGIGSYKGTRTVSFRIRKPTVSYRTHVQTYGWQSWKQNGATSGTTGQSKRLEGINIKLGNKPATGSIQYRTHVQTYGWESSWRADGAMSGTSGQSKRLEAIQIKLTGNMAKKYDVWYRVHAQQFGWMGWAKNGAKAGTAGYSYRLEGIQIKLLSKGSNAPSSSTPAFRQRPSYPIKTADSYETQDFKATMPSSWRGKWYVDVTNETHGNTYGFYAPTIPSAPNAATYARARILVFDAPEYARGSSWNYPRGSGNLTFIGKSSRGKYVYKYFINSFFGNSSDKATVRVK